MKFGTLLNSLAKKSGVDTSKKEFIDLLAVDVEIPDDIAASLDKGLMNVEAAKSHADVRKAIRSEALDGVDKKVAEMLEELGITEAEDITGEKNSYEKVAKLTRKVKELEEKKAKSGKGADKDVYEKQILELNNKIKEVNATLTAKEKEFAAARENDQTEFELHKKLLGRNYALPTEMDSDLKISTANSAIAKELAKNGFRIVRDGETGSLKIVNKENLPAYNEKNELLEVDSFIDGALARNKLLKVADPSQENGGGVTHIEIPGNQQNQQQNAYYQQQVAETNKQLADIGLSI